MNDKAHYENSSFDEIIAVTDEDIYVVKYVHHKDEGFKLGLIGSLLAFFPLINILGLYLSAKGYEQSRYQGYRGTSGLVGIFLNTATLTALIAGFFILMYAVTTVPYDVCAEMGSGSWLYNGEKYTCE